MRQDWTELNDAGREPLLSQTGYTDLIRWGKMLLEEDKKLGSLMAESDVAAVKTVVALVESRLCTEYAKVIRKRQS